MCKISILSVFHSGISDLFTSDSARGRSPRAEPEVNKSDIPSFQADNPYLSKQLQAMRLFMFVTAVCDLFLLKIRWTKKKST